MATSTPPELAATDRARWARATLGLDPEAPPAEARSQALRLLEREDFVPSLALDQACRHVAWREGQTPAPLPADDQARVAEEARLAAEVETFATDFFFLPPTDRKRRWEELTRQCAFSLPLSWRLQDLKPGLAIDSAAFQDPDERINQLGQHLRDLFPRGPLDRAVRRQSLTRGMEDEIALWEQAARQLTKKYPAVAALDLTWIRQMASWRALRKKRARRRARLKVMDARLKVSDAGTPFPNLDRRVIWGIILVAWMSLMLGKIGAILDKDSSYSPPPRTYPTAPQVDWRKYGPSTAPFPWQSTSPAVNPWLREYLERQTARSTARQLPPRTTPPGSAAPEKPKLPPGPEKAPR